MLLHLRPITLHGIRRKGLRLGIMIHFRMAKDIYHTISIQWQNQKPSKEIMNQAAIQATTMRLTMPASHSEPPKQRHGEPIVVKPDFSLDAQERYVELINFEMEVTNILATKTYKLTEEEEVPVIKNGLG